MTIRKPAQDFESDMELCEWLSRVDLSELNRDQSIMPAKLLE